jgi:pyruvate dehydrogenase (quinone)
MSRTVSDFFWDRLSQWGVKTIFGFPGDGINGLLGALNRASPSTSPTVIRLDRIASRSRRAGRSICASTT